MVSKCEYDLLCGEVNVTTPLRYELNYRNYYYVTSGEVNIKLVPPNKTKYLYFKIEGLICSILGLPSYKRNKYDNYK